MNTDQQYVDLINIHDLPIVIVCAMSTHFPIMGTFNSKYYYNSKNLESYRLLVNSPLSSKHRTQRRNHCIIKLTQIDSVTKTLVQRNGVRKFEKLPCIMHLRQCLIG
jgi:ribosomal protein L20A (L18A)